LRDQLAAIIAAEEKPPPSLPEVARRLECPLSTLRKGHPDLCRQLAQQGRVYRQAQTSLLEAQVRDILAANETPPPSLPQVAQRLGTSVTTLGRRLPALCAEIVRRHQADRQMERQRRQAFLDQLIAENPATPPSLSQVAQSLGLRKTDSLPRKFPEASRLIAARYEVYQEQARALAEAALQAALNSAVSPLPSLIQIAQQLGYPNSTYLQIHFPDLCHQLVQRCQASKQQVARAKLETFLSSASPDPTLSLSTISRRLGYHYATLKRLCPDLCQTITERYQSYRDEKKRAVKQALEAVLNGERTPPFSVRAIAIEFGYTTNTLYRSFPDLTASVIEKHKTYLEDRGQPGHI
jgi:AraC-like DNA-binding protein